MWLDGVEGGDKVFYTTGRLTSEMVIKGAQMSIPFLLSRSGTTQMGHSVATRLGMTLLARCTGRHFLLLTSPQRLIAEPELATVPPVSTLGSGSQVDTASAATNARLVSTCGPDPMVDTDAAVGGDL
jgi:FdhD protein